MLMLAIIFSVLAAFLNALSALVQRRASKNAPKSSLFTPKLSWYLFTHRLWLFGIFLQTLAFFLQAAALANGELSLVEPIMTVDLLLLLAMMFFYYHIPLGPREWIGGSLVVIGLIGFLATAQPSSGTLNFDPVSWITVGSVVIAVVLIAVFAGRFMPKLSRAGALGFATGSGYALTEALTKLCVGKYSHGLIPLFTSWEIYALFVVGLGSVVLMQNAYSAGPLSTSQPAIMVVASLGAVVLGVYLFGEVINHSLFAIGFETISGIILIAGIVSLTSSKVIAHDQKISGNVGYS